MTTRMKLPIEEWLYLKGKNGCYEDEIKHLFFELEDVLRKKGLLRPAYLKYRNFHFTQLCRELYKLSFHHGQRYAEDT